MLQKIRCSSLDRIVKCVQSLWLPQHEYATEYSIKGTTQHELLKNALNNLDSVDHYLKEMNYNTEIAFYYLKDVIDKGLEVHIEQRKIREFHNFILQGTPDAYWYDDCNLYILDLKNGYQEVDPLTNQLKGYGLLTHRPETKYVHIIIIQDGEVKKISFQNGLLYILKLMIDRSILYKHFESGEHCTYCPSKQHCKKMRDPLDNKDEYELLRNESHIKKMLVEVKTRAQEEHPEWFYTKKWGRGERVVFKGGR